MNSASAQLSTITTALTVISHIFKEMSTARGKKRAIAESNAPEGKLYNREFDN
jgi:hypothetical protein